MGQFSVAMRVTVWIYRDCFPDSFLLGIRKVVNGHSFILIRQMAELVRRALAVVCTVPVLLVLCRSVFHVSVRIKLVHPPSYILRIGAVRALVWVDME